MDDQTFFLLILFLLWLAEKKERSVFWMEEISCVGGLMRCVLWNFEGFLLCTVWFFMRVSFVASSSGRWWNDPSSAYREWFEERRLHDCLQLPCMIAQGSDGSWWAIKLDNDVSHWWPRSSPHVQTSRRIVGSEYLSVGCQFFSYLCLHTCAPLAYKKTEFHSGSWCWR